MSHKSLEEVLELFHEHGIDLEDICRVIVYWYDFSVFDGTPVGKLRDAARDILSDEWGWDR